MLLCAACGGLAIILGSLFAVLYFVLRSYTSSLHYFETVPSYVASVVLIVTGLLMLCFGWRRNRFGYLVKLCGACCLVCAVVCVVITVTTTVVHMNRLQTLRECIYNARARICTCFTGSSSSSSSFSGSSSHFMGQPLDSGQDQGSARFIFADTADCEVIHGALYACLRALFGLSVIGILVSLFSGMLVYQLLGHERKKMYWEQLELRSRTLFRRHHPPPCCGCCQDCRFAPSSGNAMVPWPPWDVLDDSYWGLHGGNLYSPGPCANGGPGGAAAGSATCNGQGHGAGAVNGVGGCPAHRRNNPPWNWLPWRPSTSENSDISSRTSQRRIVGDNETVIIGPDDHYGFPLSVNSSYRSPLALAATSPPGAAAQPHFPPERSERSERAIGWGPPPPYSRGGSNSETGSISIVSGSASLCMSPAQSPAPSGALAAIAAAGSPNPESHSSRKDQKQLQQQNVVRQKTQIYPSPVARMNVDPRRMPWSPQTAAAMSPSHAKNGYSARGGRVEPECELYFGDTSTSSFTISPSMHNEGCNGSAMYEEIHGHRYDTLQRPTESGGKSCQRSSWDVPANQRLLHQSQPKVPKIFSPIVVPKFIICGSSGPSSWVSNQTESTVDSCSFVPYHRAAVVSDSNANSNLISEEVYENVTNLDFDDKKPRALSPDEEVAIITSQFCASPQIDDVESTTQLDSDNEDDDSIIRAVNV